MQRLYIPLSYIKFHFLSNYNTAQNKEAAKIHAFFFMQINMSTCFPFNLYSTHENTTKVLCTLIKLRSYNDHIPVQKNNKIYTLFSIGLEYISVYLDIRASFRPVCIIGVYIYLLLFLVCAL